MASISVFGHSQFYIQHIKIDIFIHLMIRNQIFSLIWHLDSLLNNLSCIYHKQSKFYCFENEKSALQFDSSCNTDSLFSKQN